MRKGFTPHLFRIASRNKSAKARFESSKGAGFTLIETIIYVALFSLIIGLTIGAVYNIIEGSDSLQKNIIADAEAHFLTRKIEWALTGVSTINLPASGLTGTSLSLNKVSYAQNPIVFDLDSNNLRIKKGLANPVILNSSNVTISDLQFEHLAAGLYRPAAIKVTFKVNGEPFRTTIYLRK